MTQSPLGILGRAFWNLYARIYDTLMVFRPYKEMLTSALEAVELPRGCKVLDAGCGTGNLTSCLVGHGYEVTALDASESMLQRAQTKCPGAHFVLADLTQPLPFESQSFDALTCSNVLYTLAQPHLVLREFLRVLRPGGKLVLTNPVPGCSPDKILAQHWRESTLEGRWLMLLALPQIILLFAFNRFLLTRDRRARLYLPGSAELEHLMSQEGLINIRISPSYARQSWLAAAQTETTLPPCPVDVARLPFEGAATWK